MNKMLKILLYISLFFGILVGLIFFTSSYFIEKALNEKLDDEHIAGIYKLQFKRAYFDVFNMGVSVTGLELSPDSSNTIIPQFKHQKYIFQAEVRRITITGIDFILFIQENQVDINKIKIIKPRIKLYQNKDFIGETQYTLLETQNKEESSFIDLILLEDISIKSMSLEYYLSSKLKPDLSIESIDIGMTNPIIDHKKFPELNKVLSVDDMTLKLKDISFYDKNSLYLIQLQSLKYDYTNSSFYLDDLSINPRLSKSDFAKKQKSQADRFDGKIEKISLENLDISRLVNEKVLAIEQIRIQDLNMEVFRDKNFPFNEKNAPKLPQLALRSIKQKIEINKIDLENANLVYMESSEGKKKPGKVEFKNVQAQISNFGNTKEWQANREMKVNAQTQLYGKGHLSAKFNFPLASNTFYFSGQLGKTSMPLFNKMTINSTGVEIKEGIIDKMEFNIVATSTKSSGELSLHYHDLKISILKKEEETGEVKERKMFNFLANNLLLPSQNPNKKDQLYVAQIEFERIKNKGTFNYLWKSVFSGIKDTFLKSNKDEQSYSKQNTQDDSDLSKRELRRKARQEKRDQKKNKTN